ncbi:MAG: prephenate dehydrogenase [Candidatus Delongbacteria bacterium]|nr:prephenate dehydrogenase [Candidatus Delongbacteria bacterium]
MKIVVIGTGHMGLWLAETLARSHQVAVFDIDPDKTRNLPIYLTRLETLNQVHEFKPWMLINAVTLSATLSVFQEILPYVPEETILCDIASVKSGFHEFYLSTGRRFVSVHPMFGPTFANLQQLQNENAVIITESDQEGTALFFKLFTELKQNIFEYSFEEHDRIISYSLSIPFISTMVFAACMNNKAVPGTTFKKHLNIAQGLLSESDNLLAEILFNPFTVEQIEKINSRLTYLTHIIKDRDFEEMQKFFNRLRDNVK